jgi:hypothetical protein
MLRSVESEDGQVITVYAARLAVGGVALVSETVSHWALFSLRPSELSDSDKFEPLGGTETSMEAAYDALVRRWNEWLLCAGLVPAGGAHHSPADDARHPHADGGSHVRPAAAPDR